MIPAVVFELLVKPLWHRTPARIRGTDSGGAPPETSTTLPLEVVEVITAHLIHDTPSLRACALTSYSWYIAAVPYLHQAVTTEKCSDVQNIDCPNPLHPPHTVGLLPLEVVEMIVAYLIYDPSSLRACTMICYSWYIAALPHLHHTLTIEPYSRARNFEWSDPLQRNHELGLLPLIKRLRVPGSHDDHVGLSPILFNCRILRQFLALSNVRELEVGYLDIPNFMPRIRRYFRNFLPTIRSLSLREPRGSHRQIIYFIGLFQHLQNLKLVYSGYDIWQKTVNDPTLFPPFIPPLRGWLTMANFAEVGFLKAMINLFGGIRFYHMNLCNVDGMRLLLDAGAETLKSVAFSPADSDRYVTGPSLRDFDLSQNKSLRRLQVPASSIGLTKEPDATLLKYLLSTITSPATLEVMVVYSDNDFHGIDTLHTNWPYLREPSRTERAYEASRHRRRFEALRDAHKVRAFRLVLCAYVWGCVGDSYPVRRLEEAVEEEKAERGFDDFSSDPLVMYYAHRVFPLL